MRGCQLQQQQQHKHKQQQQPQRRQQDDGPGAQAQVQLPSGVAVAQPAIRTGRRGLRRRAVAHCGHGPPAVQQRQRRRVQETVAHHRLADGRADGADRETGQGAVRAVRPVEAEAGRRVHEKMRRSVAHGQRGRQPRDFGGRKRRWRKWWLLHTATAGDGGSGRSHRHRPPRRVPRRAPGRPPVGTARPETVRGRNRGHRHRGPYCGVRGRCCGQPVGGRGDDRPGRSAPAPVPAAPARVQEKHGRGFCRPGVRVPGIVPGRRPGHVGQSRVACVRGRRARGRLRAPRPRRSAARPDRGGRRSDRRRSGRLDTLQRRMDGTPIVLQTGGRQQRKSCVHSNPVSSVIAHSRHIFLVVVEVVRLHICFPMNQPAAAEDVQQYYINIFYYYIIRYIYYICLLYYTVLYRYIVCYFMHTLFYIYIYRYVLYLSNIYYNILICVQQNV